MPSISKSAYRCVAFPASPMALAVPSVWARDDQHCSVSHYMHHAWRMQFTPCWSL
jgi:hypothetical protein